MPGGPQQSHVDIRVRQYQALAEVAESIAGHRDLTSLLLDLRKRLHLLVKIDGAQVVLHDAKENVMRRHFLPSPSYRGDHHVTELAIEEAPGGWVWQTQQPLLITDIDAYESRYRRIVGEMRDYGVKTAYLLPLTSVGRRLGAIVFISRQETAWSEDDQAVLQQAAKIVAVAVDNVINFENASTAQKELQRQLDRLRLMLKITNEVVSQLDLQELLRVICSSIREAMGNDIVDVSLFDTDSGELRAFVTNFQPEHPLGKAGYAIPLEGGPSGMAFTSGQPVFLDKPDFERFPSDLSRVFFEEGYRSGGTIPLIAQGRKLGVLGVISRQENFFSDDEKEFLVQVANQIAIAVDNSLNYERARAAEDQAKRESKRAQLLLDINNAVASHLDLRALMEAILSCLRKVFPYEIVGLAIYDAEINQLRSYANVVPGIPQFLEDGEPIPLERTIPGLVFTSGEPVLLDRFDDPRFGSKFSKKFFDAGFRSGGSVPLTVHHHTLGALGVGSRSETHLSKDEVELLCQVASQIAIAVENALNYERARKAEQQMARERQRLALLLDINNKIASTLDLHQLFKAISACLRSVLHHDFADLGLYDAETDRVQVYAVDRSERIQFGEEDAWVSHAGTPPGLAIHSRKTVLLERPSFDEFPSEGFRRAVAEGIRSGCSVPLISRDRVIGVMNVASGREAAFTADDAKLLTEVGSQVAIALDNALAYREIETLKNKVTSEKLYLESEIRTEHNFEDLIGSSAVFRRILKQVETVAPTDSAVLIRGETGTGKELLARAIHNLSTRRERTLVKVNCAAIPTGLLESELFGHEKGAFTGAISQRIGRFELAHKGTLFLDEVGDIPLELQPKLLRVIQEQEFERLGSTRTQKVDVRLIAATNSNLEQMVADKKYRTDLYYRLNVFPVTIPPLRERSEDIPALTRFFTQRYARRLKKRIEAIPAETMVALTRYHWPGNVRELEHFIERAAILTQGPDLEVSLSELKQTAPSAAPATVSTLEAAEREHILRALQETNWVVGGPKGAAARLGMKRTTLQSRMQKLGLERTGS